MSGPFKLKYKNSAFPFKEDDEKKKQENKKIKEQIRTIEYLQLKRLEHEETKKNLIA